MGYGHDEMIEGVWADEALRQDDADDGIWQERNGDKVHVSKMSNRHILNCLRCIDNRRFQEQWLKYYGDQWRENFINELESRGVKYTHRGA